MVMKVTVTGEQRTIAQLKAFDNNAYQRITKALLKAGEGVRDEARSLTPSGNALSGWGRWQATDAGRWIPLAAGETRNLGFSGSTVRSKIRVNLTQDKKKFGYNLFFVRIVTMDPGGAAYSLSGSKRKRASSGLKYAGISFVDNLNRKHGTEYPRGLLPAVKSKGPEARPLIEAAMNEAVVAANHAINVRR